MRPKIVADVRRHLTRARLLVWRHGWWAPFTLAAVLAGVAVWQWEVLPTRDRLRLAEARLLAPRSTAAPSRPDPRLTDAARLAAVRDVLPPYRENTEVVRRIAALTMPELRWSRADFRHSADEASGIVRLQIDVPTTGPYRKIREGIERALLETPTLSLDQLSFRREQVAQTEVQARISFSLWMSAPPKPATAAPVSTELPR